MSRGWEEYKKKFPHLAHEQRQTWSERVEVKAWLEGGGELWLGMKECRKSKRVSEAQKREVEKWLRGGGGM